MRSVNNNKLCPVLNAKMVMQSIEEVPVIIQMSKNNKVIKRNIENLTSDCFKELSIIDGYAGNISTDIIYKLSTSPEVEYISFDTKVFIQLDVASSTMEAYFPHDKGYEGEGISIAVIDTGVAPHEDLVKPNNRIVNFKDFVNGKTEPYDDNGHGTHVAGIIAGNGYSSRGRYTGVAPKANIVAIKALDSSGAGSTSDIISAISYIIEVKDKYNIKVVNISLGTPATNDCKNDPLCKAMSKATDAGLIVVVAAGNSGPGERTILSPGISKDAITVGAVDDKRTIDPSDDTIATFSSRGPTRDGVDKPDLVAPGVNIRSLSNSKLDSYSSLSGTSMATPLVSGSVALLLNKYGSLNNEQVKDLLKKSCHDLKELSANQGAGMLNLRMLFKDELDTNRNENPLVDSFLKGDFKEDIIMLLLILFLLDSRI